jgi:dTDP-4-dehydrorhamnose reductase
MMKILLLGNKGQLGWELQRTCASLGNLVAIDFPDVDLTEPVSVRQEILKIKPDVIINATAYNAVDRAEEETEIAMAINAHAPRIMAEMAKTSGALFIHYSTDYVFDGTKNEPYVEDDIPNPINMYGSSKYAGEQGIISVGGLYLIFRTSWVYSLRRASFVTKVLKWSRENQTLKIVHDQVSCPTWCRMLAEVSAMVLVKVYSLRSTWLRDRVGLYHLAGDGYTSRFEWAQEILRLDPNPSERKTHQIFPAETDDFPTLAQRPLFSAMACDRFREAFGLQLPHWPIALKLAMESPS